jgi:hypothetical protein
MSDSSVAASIGYVQTQAKLEARRREEEAEKKGAEERAARVSFSVKRVSIRSSTT